jgi:hypothetical protein
MGDSRYGHAWCESPDRATVYDLTYRHGVAGIATSAYYDRWHLSDRYVDRYTAVEAARLMVATGHYGPWHAMRTSAQGAADDRGPSEAIDARVKHRHG